MYGMGQNTPRYSIKLLPARRADSETFEFSYFFNVQMSPKRVPRKPASRAAQHDLLDHHHGYRKKKPRAKNGNLVVELTR